MKERPIIFSAQMVRAILAGAKSQTRRPMRTQPVADGKWAGGWKFGSGLKTVSIVSPLIADACPHGQPGDRLWVREAFIRVDRRTDGWGLDVYAADYAPDDRPKHHWKSPIHMRRTASRITLEITGVRVERLQDISEADAQAEGCGETVNYEAGRTYAAEYRELWDQINGACAWDANPWVWVLEFRRVTP